MISIKNPIVLFIVTWLSVLFMYSRQYSLILTALNDNTIIYIALTCFILMLSFSIMRLLFRNVQFSNENIYEVNPYIIKQLKWVLGIWIAFSMIEILYFKGLPLLALLGIGSGVYTEWGLPSLHGLLNAMIITLSNYMIYLFLKTKDKKYLYFFLSCLCWPILLVTRQVFMSMVVQATLIYLVTNKIKTHTIFKVILAAFVIVYLFGVIGDLRSEDPESFVVLAEPSADYPTWLPSGFLWVYIYIASPLNNINFNIDHYKAFDFNLAPILSPFFPSVIRDKFFDVPNQDFQLVKDYFNVSSMFPTFINSFGYWGSIISYFFLGSGLSFVFLKTKQRIVPAMWVFVLIVLLHNVMFSIFVDFFTSLVFVFQMVLHLIIGTTIKKYND